MEDGAVHEAGLLQAAEGGEPVPGGAVLVDVENVGAWGAGGDSQVRVGVAGEPAGDLVGVGGGVVEAVRGGRDFLAGLAGEHRPAAGGVGAGQAERRSGHDGFLGRPGSGLLRGWPQWVVSRWSWPARAGRMRAWYSACADSVPGSRPGCRYRTDHKVLRMSRPYRSEEHTSEL